MIAARVPMDATSYNTDLPIMVAVVMYPRYRNHAKQGEGSQVAEALPHRTLRELRWRRSFISRATIAL